MREKGEEIRRGGCGTRGQSSDAGGEVGQVGGGGSGAGEGGRGVGGGESWALECGGVGRRGCRVKPVGEREWRREMRKVGEGRVGEDGAGNEGSGRRLASEGDSGGFGGEGSWRGNSRTEGCDGV